MIKTVVFDLDDTLYAEHQFVHSGFRTVDRWLFAETGVSGFFTSAINIFNGGMRGNIFDLALAGLGIQPGCDLIARLVNVYREHKPEITLYDDARWALGYFNQSKNLGMITDGHLITQQNKVAALNIASFFDVIVYTDELGRENWKPSALPYRKIMDSLNCCGDECVYIADNPVKDFITAKKLGWKTIQISRGYGEYSHVCPDEEHQAETTIVSLVELETLLA